MKKAWSGLIWPWFTGRVRFNVTPTGDRSSVTGSLSWTTSCFQWVNLTPLASLVYQMWELLSQLVPQTFQSEWVQVQTPEVDLTQVSINYLIQNMRLTRCRSRWGSRQRILSPNGPNSKTTRGKCELSGNNSTQGTYNTLTKTEGQVNEDQVKLITHRGGEKKQREET